jgi:hypothetical protein
MKSLMTEYFQKILNESDQNNPVISYVDAKGKQRKALASSLSKYDPSHPGRQAYELWKEKHTSDTAPSLPPFTLSKESDKFSEHHIRNAILDDKITPAGIPSSAVMELLTIEAYQYLLKNPTVNKDALVKNMYEFIIKTKLGKKLRGLKKSEEYKKTQFKGMKMGLVHLLKIAVDSGKKKFEHTLQGTSKLIEQNLMDTPTNYRSFLTNSVSNVLMIKLVNSLNGPFYTKQGSEIPRELLIQFIKNAGAKKNPADTVTIVSDANGKSMVVFYSDKQKKTDTQGQSTIRTEMNRAVLFIKDSNLSAEDKISTVKIINEYYKKFTTKEKELLHAKDKQSIALVRQQSTDILRELRMRLNEYMMSVGDKKIPLGDWVETKELITTLHFDLIDDTSKQGIGGYSELFNLNIGGMIVQLPQLKNCLGVENTAEILSRIIVKVPEGSARYTYDKQNNITGDVVFIYAIGKNNEEFKLAKKIHRSKKGKKKGVATGVDSIYTYESDLTKCLERNQ